jgi:hypothetical protein
MKCDICGQDLANSEELKMHKEREHPIDERKDEQLEAPDLMDPEPDGAEPVVRPAR